MKVIHIETRFHPSYGYQVQQLVQLHGKEHDVLVVTSRSLGAVGHGVSGAELAALDRGFELETGARIIRLDSWFEWRDKILFKGLAPLIRRERPDVIYAHGVEYIALMQLIVAGVAREYPMVTDSHDLPTAGRSALLRSIFRVPHRLITVRFINKFGIRTYYVQPQTKEMLRICGIHEGNMHYLPLGVDESVFRPDADARQALRSRFSIRGDEVVLLYTGKRDHQKDPALILEAVAGLADAIRMRIWIIMVGTEDRRYADSRIAPTLATTGCAERVRMMESVPFRDLAGFYAMADIGVFPRQNTMSALDAMACGLPLIMQDDDTNRERLAAGGLLFNQGDAIDLGRKISLLVADTELRKKLSFGGREYVAKNHSYQATVKRLEADMESEIERHRNANR